MLVVEVEEVVMMVEMMVGSIVMTTMIWISDLILVVQHLVLEETGMAMIKFSNILTYFYYKYLFF